MFINALQRMAAVAGALCLTMAAAGQTSDKPNIVFLISDDHRWDGIGIAGNANVKTPNLDKMAHEGQWYRDFTIQIPTCSASRASILTGLPPYRHGWYSNEFQRKDVINAHGFDQYQTLPKQMINAGYHTVLCGKWHLKPEPWIVGFETVRRWMIGGAGAFVDPRLAEGNSREMKPVKGFTQDIFTEDALDELNKRASGETTQPLFLWVAYTAPHGPFGANPKKFEDMYAGKTAEELAPSTYYDDPAKAKKGRQNWNNYYASISALDEQVGRIHDTVRNSSLSTNTLVVFMGDNGFMMGRRDVNGKYLPYEDSLRVPMISWGSQNIMGSRDTTVTAAINSLDLSPTFVKLAGGTPPAEWTGRDFSEVLKDGQKHGIDYAYASYPDHDSLIEHAKAYRTIRSEDHKLILWHPKHNRGPEFYDLKKDPAENNNLYSETAPSDAQVRLNDALAKYRKDTGDDQWDMKGPLGMFEPERLKWMAVDEGPDKPTTAEAQAPDAGQKPKAERSNLNNNAEKTKAAPADANAAQNDNRAQRRGGRRKQRQQ